ncbi:hypothetical protein D9M68_616100 [compost metagenome]
MASATTDDVVSAATDDSIVECPAGQGVVARGAVDEVRLGIVANHDDAGVAGVETGEVVSKIPGLFIARRGIVILDYPGIGCTGRVSFQVICEALCRVCHIEDFIEIDHRLHQFGGRIVEPIVRVAVVCDDSLERNAIYPNEDVDLLLKRITVLISRIHTVVGGPVNSNCGPFIVPVLKIRGQCQRPIMWIGIQRRSKR